MEAFVSFPNVLQLRAHPHARSVPPSLRRPRLQAAFPCTLSMHMSAATTSNRNPTPNSPAPNPSQRPTVTTPHLPPASETKREVVSSLERVSYDVSGVRVVEDVTLELHDGEIVCILGPSGSGKSTLLRILAGLTKPSEGQALYKGQPFKGVNPGTSIVFQTFALYPWLTVLENVELGLASSAAGASPSHVDRDLLRTRAMRAIDNIGLDGYENAYPRELSGGMRQRVGFARALAVEPELLCMDEPFSALDVLTAQNLRSELLRLWQAGDVPTTSVLIVTHGIEEAVTLADRIVILGRDPGHVRTILPVNLTHPRNRKAQEFQAMTDLVYTILSDVDYQMSAEDLAVLNCTGPVSSDALVATSTQAHPLCSEDIDSKRVVFSNLKPATSKAGQPTSVYLEGLNLSDPLRPVSPSDLHPVQGEYDTPLQPALPPPEARYPQLPAVRIGSVSGLLSFIVSEESAYDLYVLGQRLQLDVDDLYPLIDAADTLGLIEVDEGDVRINRRGLVFEQASIDQRKNMVRSACLEAPGTRLISQIHRLLSEAQSQKLPQELIFDTILLKHFSPVEARRQLEIAIEWGRFAELFGYESLTGTLFLDTGDIPQDA